MNKIIFDIFVGNIRDGCKWFKIGDKEITEVVEVSDGPNVFDRGIAFLRDKYGEGNFVWTYFTIVRSDERT